MSTDLNELVNRALLKWAEVAGVRGGDEDDYDLQKFLGFLNETRELDPGGLTTFMLLRGAAEDMCRRVTFTGLDLLEGREAVERRMAPLVELRALVEDLLGTSRADEFAAGLRRSAAELGASPEKLAEVDSLLASRYDLGCLRRDAITSLERLEHHQFAQGRAAGPDLARCEHVYEFLNPQSAVQAALLQRVPGISMVMVRDPEVELASYFAFLVANGDVVTVVTDRDEGPHPAYQRMSRRPDRNLERRAERHWFPYHLMDLEWAADGRSFHVHRESLVRTCPEPVRLARLADLEAEQLAWALMVFDLLRIRYGRQDARLPELSYVGECLVDPLALVGSCSELSRTGGYAPLVLPPPTAAEVEAAAGSDQWAFPSTRFNAWMEERYGAEVPPEVYSPVGEARARLAAAAADRLLPPRDPDSNPLMVAGEEVRRVSLESLHPCTFGTRDKILRDREWVARVNKMRVVQQLAEAEYERERGRVYGWWRERCEARRAVLVEAVARGELVVPHVSFRHDDPDRWPFVVGYMKPSEENCLGVYFDKKEFGRHGGFVAFKWGDVLLNGSPDDPDYMCAVTRRRASVFGVFRPTCPGALARLAGVDVEDMPVFLRHWYSEVPYQGNSILDRVEPGDWVLRNPWISSHCRPRYMHVVCCLSRTAYNRERRRLGLPRREFEKEVDRGDE